MGLESILNPEFCCHTHLRDVMAVMLLARLGESIAIVMHTPTDYQAELIIPYLVGRG